MPPVVGFERDGAPCGRDRVAMFTGAFEDEAQRAPAFRVFGVEAAGFIGVMRGQAQRLGIRSCVSTRHLELQDAGVGEADVRRCRVGRKRHDAREHLAGAHDLIALQRFESGAAVEQGAMRCKQGVDVVVRRVRGGAHDRAGQAITLARNRFDILIALRVGAERAPEGRDRLFEAVVADGGVGPARSHEVVFRNHRAGVCGQVQQHADVAVAQGDTLTVSAQLPGAAIDLEGAERVDDAAHHPPSARSSSGSSSSYNFTSAGSSSTMSL